MAELVGPEVQECVEWIARCVTRLVTLHPACSLDQGTRIAVSIWADARWRRVEPEAAVEMLFPNAATRIASPHAPLPATLLPRGLPQSLPQ